VIMAGVPRKLVVEVLAAKALMPKDGEGSSNAYCVVICSTCVVHSFLLLCSWSLVSIWFSRFSVSARLCELEVIISGVLIS